MAQPQETLDPTKPFPLTDDQEKEIREEVSMIVTEQAADTAEFQRQLIQQRRLYEMKARRKTWPWPGAANFIIPIVRYIVDHYKGRITQTFRQSETLWHGSPIGTQEIGDDGRNWKEIAESAANFLDFVCKDPSHVNFFEFADILVDYVAKDGTAPVKVHFVNNTKRRGVYNSKTKKVEAFEEPYEQRVAWDVIDLQRAVWTVGGTNPDDMPVFGHWMEMTRGQVLSFAQKYGLDAAKIKKILDTPDDPWFIMEERILDDEMGIKRSGTQLTKTLNVYRIYELSVEYPIAPNEPPMLMTVWWHQNSQTVLAVFDPQDYAKPYEVARFLRRGRQFLGSCPSDALRVLNLGANAVVNQTTDAQTIANAYGFKYKAGGRAEEFIANSGIFPGVKIPVDDDVDKEFKEFQLGSGNTAVSLNLLNFYLQMSEMVGKVGQSQMGNVATGSRVAASVGLGVMQEGAQMIDSVISSLRDTIDRCGLRTLFLYANHAPDVFDEALGMEKADLLLSAIRDPEANFPKRIRIRLNVSSAAANREKDKQDLIVLANFMFNVFKQITEVGPIVTNPMAPPPLKQLFALVYKGMSEIVTRTVGQFDQFKDPTVALPKEILGLFETLAAMPQPGMMPGAVGPGGPGGPTTFPGVAPGAGGGAEALGPAATGAVGRPAAGLPGLLGALGGGNG